MPEPDPVLQYQLSEFILLNARRLDLEAKLEDTKKRLHEIERGLLDTFAEAGIQRITRDGTTIYLHRQLWVKAKDGDYDRACTILRALGLEDMVQARFNSQTVSAYFREMDPEMVEALPAAVHEALAFDEVFHIRTRKG